MPDSTSSQTKQHEFETPSDSQSTQTFRLACTTESRRLKGTQMDRIGWISPVLLFIGLVSTVVAGSPTAEPGSTARVPLY